MSQVTLKGVPYHTNKKMVSQGEKGAVIVGMDVHLQERSTAEFSGKKKVICFVPSLDTPVCSLSMSKFVEALRSREDVVLVYVSVDTPFAIQRSCVEQPGVLVLSLVRSKKSAQDFGVIIENGPLQGFCTRAVIVLDQSDTVVYAELVEEITSEPNYAATLAHV